MDNSAVTARVASSMFGVSESTVRRWMRYGCLPDSEVNKQKYEAMMKFMKKNKRIEWHPSYGYATEEQMEQLKTLKLGPERDRVLAAIKKQTESKGKIEGFG